jgi:aspartate kinase
VLLAVLLRADRCELVKDVDGYFTADPHADPAATLIPSLDFPAALELANEGCPLVQRQAIIAARDANLPIVVRSLRSEGTTVGAHTRDFLTSRLSDFRSPVVF